MLQQSSRNEFTFRAIVAFAIAAILFLVWELGSVLFLIFGGIVFATVIRIAAEPLERYLHISQRWASVIIILLFFATLALIFYFFGMELSGKIQELRNRIPEAMSSARSWLSSIGLGEDPGAQSGTGGDNSFPLSRIMNAASATISFLVDLILVALVAIYVGFNPGLYSRGVLALVPSRWREQARIGLSTSSRGLRGWLLGQLVSMATIGVLTAAGLWLVGVPLPFALGLIAGLLEFIPILGPWLAAVPGVLLAFTVSPTTALYAALVYLVVQQLESNVVMPVAQRWAVSLPPALGLAAVVVFGILFGLPGLLFGAPLTVVIMVLVRRLYLDDPPV